MIFIISLGNRHAKKQITLRFRVASDKTLNLIHLKTKFV